ncbi:MAG: PEP-CTERM sorting domain-containing protein, partial [Planctomycetota bacterium]|nr:PEP-CTERM sorting domain-containing protein [Planctomycetota bacterium]
PADPVTDHRLYINGVAAPGTIESLAGEKWVAGPTARNAYIRIDAVGPEQIFSIGFENISAVEFLEFDHLAFSIETVPEPSTIALLLTGSVGLIGYGRRRKRRLAASTQREILEIVRAGLNGE